jgi:hypothetical protein
MASQDFTEQLKELGVEAKDLGDGKVSFEYIIPTGRFAGHNINLGFIVPNDFSLTPPSGLHVSPRLLPLQPGGSHPSGGIHESPFGPDWEYWSRPIPHWKTTRRTVRDVMAHVRHLFDTQ